VASDIIQGYEIKEVIGSITGDSDVTGSKRFGVRIAEPCGTVTDYVYSTQSRG
jgi:hypothetical protein